MEREENGKLDLVASGNSALEAKIASLESFRPDLDESGKELFDMLMGCAREMLFEVERKNLALSVS